MPVVLQDPCQESAGHHFCLTHEQHFRNNLEANAHEREGCQFAWWCDFHGPERAS